MDNVTLRKVQMELLKIAIEFRRVCKELSLPYFLDSGTLLGAVRHKGFIPWDDDMDVGMLRRDYDEFMEKAPELLSDKFVLQTWESDGDYGLAFAKLRMKNTVYLEEGSQNAGKEHGFYIDIFPYDVFPDSKQDKKWQRWRYALLRRMILVKSGYQPWLNDKGMKSVLKRLIYMPISLLSCFFKREKMIRIYEESCQKFNNQPSTYLYEQAGAANYGKWIIPRECFSDFVEMQFEGERFSCPAKYDLYLRSAYGDYMQLPPEEKRINRHGIIEVKFSE